MVGTEIAKTILWHTKSSVERTDNLLLRGFILRLDPAKQQEFLDNVPFPALSPAHAGYIAALEHGTEEEKIRAVKRIESEARSQTRRPPVGAFSRDASVHSLPPIPLRSLWVIWRGIAKLTDIVFSVKLT